MVDKSKNRKSEELERQLELVHEAVIEGQRPPIELAPELESAQALFRLIERVRQADGGQTHGLDSAPSPTADRSFEETIDKAVQVGDVKDLLSAESPTEPFRIGRFEIVKSLGQGGYGMVFLAHDPKLDRDVAIKVPRPEVVVSEQTRRRFLREAKAAAILSHPRIVPVYEIFQMGSVGLIVSQYIEGPTLSEWLDENSETVAPRLAAAIVRDLADAVQYAHNRGVLHRDLKPSNILCQSDDAGSSDDSDNTASITDTPIPMITDFGLAKFDGGDGDITGSGDILGTPSYMAPEQTTGTVDVGAPADIYGLGAILYRMVTGRKPFQELSIAETLRAVQDRDPIPPRHFNPKIPKDFEAICLKCLEKSPARRYASAYDLHRDLCRFLDGETVLARRATPVDRFVKWARRNPALASAISLSMIILLSGLITVSILLAQTQQLFLRAERLHGDATATVNTLREAVDEMLLALANMPEIETAGFEAVRHRLLERANDYYELFVSSQPEDPDLQRKYSATLLNLAKVKSKLGDHPGALDLAQAYLSKLPSIEQSTDIELWQRTKAVAFLAGESVRIPGVSPSTHIEQALQLARQLHNQDDGSQQATIDYAMTLETIANVYGILGNRTESLHYITEAVRLWQHVDSSQVDDIETKAALGRTLVSAAQIHSQAETGEEGIRYCQSAIDFFELQRNQNAATDAMLYELAKAYRVMSWFQRDNLDLSQVSTNRAMVLLAELIARHPQVPVYQQMLLGVQYSAGLNLYLAERYEEAAEIFEENIEDCEALLLRFPEAGKRAEERLGDNLTMLGIVRKRQGDYHGQMDALRRSQTIIRARYEATGHSNEASVALSGVEGELSNCLNQLGQSEEAMATIELSNARLFAVLDRDPENGEAKRFLSNGLGHKSDLLGKRGDFKRAIDAARDALELDLPPQRCIMFHRLAKWNLKSGNLDEAIVQARAIDDDCRTGAGDPGEGVQFCSEQLAILDALADNELIEPRQIDDARAVLVDIGVGLAEWAVNRSDDSTTLLQFLDEDASVGRLRESPAYQAWRAGQ